MQESDYPTEESKRKFICESFKLDENEILNRDEKLKEEVIKLFLENFLALELHPNHYGKTDILELRIELQPGAVPKRSKVKSSPRLMHVAHTTVFKSRRTVGIVPLL